MFLILIDIAQIPIVHIHFKLRLTLEKDWERSILQGHSPLDFILKYRPNLVCLSKSSKEKDIGDICPLFYVTSSGFQERNYKIEIAFRETTSCTCHLVSNMEFGISICFTCRSQICNARIHFFFWKLLSLTIAAFFWDSPLISEL